MFKTQLWQSHDEYRTIVNSYCPSLSRNNTKYSFDLYDKERQKLLDFSLDPLLDYIPQFYSDRGRPASDNPEAVLQTIFTLLALLPSLRLGLIDAAILTLSGDGTAVVSHSSPYGRPLSSCARNCPYRSACPCHYSDPDAG